MLLYDTKACLLSKKLSLYAALHLRNCDQKRGSVGMRHCIIQRSSINQHAFSVEGQGEAVQAARSRAIQVFAVNMVMRAVTGTFETDTIIAKRHGTAQVNAALIQAYPVRAIAILNDRLRGQFVSKRCPAQQKIGIFIQVYDISFRRLVIENTRLVYPEI